MSRSRVDCSCVAGALIGPPCRFRMWQVLGATRNRHSFLCTGGT
jgi:hypothetical protein